MTETEWGILEKNLEKSILEGFTEEVTWDGEPELIFDDDIPENTEHGGQREC